MLNLYINVFLFYLINIVVISSVSASVLEETVLSMKQGSWEKLDTIGMSTEFLRSDSKSGGGSITLYANSATWDPNTRQLLYLGGPHGDPLKFIIYSEETNSWREGPLHPCEYESCDAHTYDHNTINPNTSKLYYRSFAGVISRRIFEFDVKTETWTEPFEPMPLEFVQRPRTSCLEFFKEQNALIGVFPRGHVVKLDLNTKQWKKIASGLDVGKQHVLCEYNPIHKHILFGGGNSKSTKGEGSKDIYLLNKNLSIYKLKPAKIGLRVPGRKGTNVVVDPVSGNFIILDDKHQLFEFNPIKDEWKLLSDNAPISARTTVVAPISTYGVMMFVTFKYKKNQKTGVYLYKHRDM